MNNQVTVAPSININAPSGPSLFETFLCFLLLTLLGAGAWSLFNQLPAYGGQSSPLPPSTSFVAQAQAPAPVCFNRTREQVESQGAEAGCPSDPMSYRVATLRQTQG